MSNKNEKVQGNGVMAKFMSMNKWFYAFLAAAVLFVGAIVAVLIIALGGEEAPVDNNGPLPEGAETGVYYYDAEKGEYLLSINSGNKFTIAGPDLNKSGEYTVAGSEITLDFVKDEDGTAKVTIADNVLTMLWNETEMRFLKKVSFNVTFQTDGGSAVTALSVLNGKTAAMPAAPTKDGYAFIGWYADAECTKAFDFATTVIGADTAVYAKWVKLEAGVSEYNVSFNLGYEGATAPAATKTTNGKLYTLPTPTREGYTFAGWWISACEDGEKLTYACTTETALAADTTLFALWIDNAGQKLPAPAVSVFANAIKWDTVSGATSYALTITNAAGETVLTKNVGTTNETFDFTALAGGDYTVSVVAVSSDASKNSEPALRYYRNKALDRVSGYTLIDGVLVMWNPVAGAEKYIVTVDCGNDAHTHTAMDNGRNTFFNIANCPMQKGGVKITVVAVANGYEDSVATSYTYEKNLAAIEAIVYDKVNATFSWERIENAVKYFVLVKCGGHSHTLVDNGNATSYSVKYCTGAVAIEVYPATAGYNSPDATKTAITKTSLAAPSNVTLVGNQLTWDAVAGATAYQVKIGAQTFDATENSYDLANTGINFIGGVDYEISVLAVGAENSAYSDKIVAKAFALSNVAYYNNTVSWSPMIGVSEYDVSVNGDTAIRVSNANSAKIALTKSGVNTISVRYNGSTEWITIEVYAYEVIYDSRTLTGVAKEYLAIGDTMAMPATFTLDGYTFAGWYNAPGGAAGNGVAYPHAVFSENADTVLYANWTPRKYNIVFYGCETVDGINNGDTFEVTYTKPFKLPVPAGDDTSDFFGWVTLSGEPVTDAEGNSLAPYGVTRDTSVCPYFDTGIVNYTLRPDGTYAASKGPGIDTATTVTIRETYKGVKVTAILENGFYDCDKMIYINIPDTIELIGAGAFVSCNYLQAVNVYEVQTQTPHEVFYSSDDGALVFYDKASDLTYLELFPRGKTGHYKMSDEVDVIRDLAFDTVSISSIEISSNVSLVVKKAFYNCRTLKSVTFAPKGTVPLTLEAGAFTNCKAIEVMVLPARMNELASMRELDVLTGLKSVDIEKGNAYYSAVDGMLCDELGQTVLYCPKGYAGNNGVFAFATSVRTISASVFEGNPNVKEVVIPASMDAIDAKAFYNCAALTKVTIEGNRSKPLAINDWAFALCVNLAEVNFGSADSKATVVDAGAITIGTSAFANTANTPGKLKTVNVYAGVNIAAIGDSAFAYNVDFSKLNVAEVAAITAIGTSAFANTGFSAFTLHESTQSVGNQAFANCEYLTTFTFSANEELVFGSYAFQNCKRLNEVILPATVTTFDPSALDGCTNLEKITVEKGSDSFVSDEYGILYTAGFAEIIFYPSTLDGDLSVLPWDKIQTIGANVFAGNTKIKSVTFGANVTEIASSAFQGCTNLATVAFAGESYADLVIGANAFNGCSKLTAIDLSKGVSSIGAAAFKNCSVLATAVLPDTLTVISDSLFESCKKLTTVNLPAALQTIGKSAFYYVGVTAITIPNTVTFIGDNSFRYSAVQTLTFAPGGTAELTIGTASAGQGAFASSKLAGVLVLPERLTSLGAYVFASCASLTEVKFPANSKITALSRNLFQSSGIKTVDLTGIKTIGDYAFNNCKQLTTLVIPEGVTSIGANAFTSSNLATVTLPGTLKSIGNYAFQSSKLATVTIPKSVTYIGNAAFKSTTAMKTVTFELGGTEDLEIADNAFNSTVFTTITLPARLAKFGSQNSAGYSVFDGNKVLTAIIVEEGTGDTLPAYASYDGIIYRNQNPANEAASIYAALLFSPQGKKGTAKVAKEVLYVETQSFRSSTLTEVIFEEFEKTDARYGVPTLIVGRATSAYGSMQPVFTSTTITKVQFPSHLRRLNNHAMDSNGIKKSGMQIVFNMDSLVEFGPYVFARNTYFTEMHLPKVASLERNAFQGATKVKTITVAPGGSTVKTISEQAFRGCSALTAIVIPESVETIQKLAFEQCQALASIEWQNGCPNLETIGDSVFSWAAFTEFKIPDAVQWVGNGVWSNCTKMLKMEVSLAMNVGYSSQNTGLFDGCTNLQEIVVPDGHSYLKAIDGALYSIDGSILYCYPQGKTGNVTLPDTLVTIEYSALYNYKGTELVLPESLEEIKSRAFNNADGLTSIVIPAKVHTIGASAFGSCDGLSAIVFAQGSQLTAIGSGAFGNCTSLTTISLPDNVETLGANAFSGCYKLETIVLSKALKVVESQTFLDCTALKNVTIQEGLTDIAKWAFQRTGLETITLPDSLMKIESDAFGDCQNLTTVILSDNGNLESIGDSAFAENPKLTSVGFGGKLQTIGTRAFQNCTALESVVLPDTVTTIGGEAFKGCTALTTVTMPAALEAIPANLFENCSKLSAITIGAAVNEIGAAAFKNCVSLATVTFDAACGLTTIPTEAFAGTTALTAIALPSAVTTIEAKAFYRSGLAELSLPMGLIVLGDEAFRGCVNLEEVAIPNALAIIPAYAFAECTSLTTLKIDTGLERINDFAFSGCTALTAVTIPDTVERLGQNPFMNCPNIETFALDNNDSFTLFEGVLYDKTMYTLLYYPASKLDETFTVPEKTKEIAGGAFSSSKLKKIVLHDEITVIPDSAFENCVLLEEIEMGAVTSIGNAAFKNCASLATFTVPASVTTLGDYAFAGCVALTNEGFQLAAKSALGKYGTHLFEGCTSITAPFTYAQLSTFTDYMYANTGITELVLQSQPLDAVGIFANCKQLTSVSWEKGHSVNEIADAVFYGCTALESVVLPEGIYYLGTNCQEISQLEYYGTLYGVFGNCTALKSVTLPTTLNQFGVSTFENCVALTDINFEISDRTMFMASVRAFKGCTSLNNTQFVSYCFSICEEAFMNCISLAGEIDFTVGRGVEMYNNAFYGCSKITGIHFGYGMFFYYALAGLGTDGLGSGLTLYAHLDPKELEGMFGRENPMENCPKATLEMAEPAGGKK